jgi:hypothetical protein
MSNEQIEPVLSTSDDNRPVVRIGGVRVATLPELVAAVPALLQPENLPVWCAAVNHLTYGRQYRLIRDPDAYRARYQRRLASEDPREPWREGVVRLCDFGVADTSVIDTPQALGDAVVFYVEDDYLGIPYRVTAPLPDHPEGEVRYEPLPTTPVAPPPESAETADVEAPPEALALPEQFAPPDVAEAVAEPEPVAAPAEPEPDPVQPLRDAVTAEDQAAVRQSLRALGVDVADCEPIFAAWDALTYRGTPVRERLPKMQQLIAAIKALKAPPAVKDELWRLQKALIKYA